MQRMACCSVIFLALAGCNGGPAEQNAAPEVPTWDGLKALNQESVMKPLMMPAQMGNAAAVKQHVDRPEFKEAFAKFESDPIPSKFKTAEREAARDEVIKSIKALIDGTGDMKANVDAADKGLKTLAAPVSAPAEKK